MITVILVDGNVTVDTNEESVDVKVRVFDQLNNPHNSGKIKIIYPDKVQTGADVGQFNPLEADVSNGEATFVYTAPVDLQALVDSGDTGSLFAFYHDSNVSATKTLTVSYSPKTNQIVDRSYTLDFLSADTNVTMPLE
ncbi:MAG: hypothetical protein GWP02_07685, partial [Desulfobulbaceae bacterium]|nr:hypothetical protein [Desulfobulbaceae bacterium]